MDKSNNSYPERQEKLDDMFLIKFNAYMHFFQEIPEKRETQQYSTIDRQLKDRNGRTVNIELKTRFCDINSFNGIFIEEKKWNALRKDYIEKGNIPLYINFFYDFHNVLIYDLRQYFDGEREEPEKKYVTINNWGYGRIDENQLRYILPQRHGTFYRLDDDENRYIRKWG